MNKFFAGLAVLGMFLHGAHAQVNIIPGSVTLPSITQAAGDLRSAAQFQRDCAAGIQADSCGGKPAPKGCPTGTVWSTEGTGVAHCVVPVVVTPEPPVVPPVTPPLTYTLEAKMVACPSGYTGTQSLNRYIWSDGRIEDWRVVLENCTPAVAPPSCVASDTITASASCPSGMIGSLITHTVNSCPGNVVSTYQSGCNIATGTIVPEDVNQDGKVDCTDLAIVKSGLNKRVGQAGYIARADMNNDGIINALDLTRITRSIGSGTTCTPCPNGAVNYPACSIMADGSQLARACLAPVNWCMTTRAESGQPRDDLYEWGWTKYEGTSCLANSGSVGQGSGLEGGCPADYPDGVPVWGAPSGYADGKP